MAQTKPKAGQFYGVSNNGTDGQFLKTDGTGGMSWDSPITNPTITSIDYPGSATAADPAGGESVVINGTLFASGITCTVGGTSAVTAFNSSTQITITTPAKAAGPYTVAVLNTNGGTASENNFIQYSGVPVWSTAAGTLGNVLEGEAASFQVTATEGSDTIEYAVTTGTLPTGLSLATATGAITGTAGSVSADTTTTFSITATDDENQTSSERSFSITVQNDAPSNHFNTVIYTGNGSTQSTNSLSNQSGTINFKPDLVWFKDRGGVYSHSLYNSISGRDRFLRSNSTNSESTGASATQDLVSFDTNGFTLGTDYHTVNNANGRNYVAWNFKAGGTAVANTDGTTNSQVSVNNTLGFSIVSYSGNSTSGATVGHGLDATPDLVIIKSSNASANWIVYSSPTGNGKYLYLNSTSSAQSANWFDTSATTFTLNNTYGDANTSGRNYIAYNFTSKPGFSKVGSYTGNGSVNGPIVQTDFEPAFLLVKGTGNVSGWLIHDNKRTPSNPRDNVLLPNRTDGDIITPNVSVDFFANGFQIKTTNSDQNGNNLNYIYLAIAADGSTATPSLANSFATTLNNSPSNNQAVAAGFTPDSVWIKSYSNSASWGQYDTVRGSGKVIQSDNTDAEYDYAGHPAGNLAMQFTAGGYTTPPTVNNNINNSSYDYINYFWKAGGTPYINTDGTTTSVVSANQAAGFSIVQQTSNNSNDTIGHGLSAAPELIISKNLSISGPWGAYNASNGVNGYLYFNQTNAWTSAPNVYPIVNSTVFSGGSGGWNNGTGNVYINYCFTSIPGYSKVGTYSGTASANSITTGFEPGFIMIKRTDSAGSWVVMDSARGMGSNASALFPNLNALQSNGWNTAFTATGFTISSAEAWINASGGTYIYLAIKEN